jgi:hypothetical protein
MGELRYLDMGEPAFPLCFAKPAGRKLVRDPNRLANKQVK